MCAFWCLRRIFGFVIGWFSEPTMQPEPKPEMSSGCIGISLLAAAVLLIGVAIGLDFFLGEKSLYHTLFGFSPS